MEKLDRWSAPIRLKDSGFRTAEKMEKKINAVIPSHSPVIARAGSVDNALRHLEFKFGRSA